MDKIIDGLIYSLKVTCFIGLMYLIIAFTQWDISWWEEQDFDTRSALRCLSATLLCVGFMIGYNDKK